MFEYYASPDSTKYIQTMEWQTALLLTLLCLIVLSVAFFIIAHFKLKKGYRNYSIFTPMVVAGFIMLAVLLILFITILVFIGLSVNSQQKALCQFVNIQNYLLTGYNNTQFGSGFLGLSRVSEALSRFGSETSNLRAAMPTALELSRLIITPQVNSAISSLNNLYNAYKDSTTFNPFGIPTRPYSIRNMSSFIDEATRQEFISLNSSGISTDNVFKAIIAIDTTVTPVNYSSAIANLNSNINATAESWKNASEAIWQRGNERLNYTEAGYWTIFFISILLFGIFALIMVLSTLILRRNLYNRYRKLILIVFYTSSFLILMYGVMVIILMAGLTAVSTFCEVLAQVNSGNLTILESLNVQFFGQSKAILTECLAGNGELLQFYATNNTNGAYEFPTADLARLINGLFIMGVYDRSVDKNTTSKGITNLKTTYNQILIGSKEDQDGVFAQLETLNDLIACSNQRAALANESCSVSSGQVCVPIKETSTFQAPSCSKSPGLANSIFTSLKTYIDSESQLLTRLINDLAGSQSSTPANAYANAKAAINIALPSIRSISNLFPATTAILNSTAALSPAKATCNSLSHELLVFEDHLCFELNYWLYIILVISAVSFVIWFGMLWVVWLAMREINARNPARNPPPLAARDIIEKRLMNLNDRESLANF